MQRGIIMASARWRDSGRMKTCQWSLTRIDQNDSRANADNQPSACLESRHDSQRIKRRAKKEKENISLWGPRTRARCQDSYSFSGGVHPFLLCAQFLLLAIVILSLGSGTFLHLPRWHAAIEEQVPVDPGFEEDKV
jgi:hypothetical protein